MKCVSPDCECHPLMNRIQNCMSSILGVNVIYGNSRLTFCEGVLLSMGTLKKATMGLLMLAAIMLIRTHWIEIVPLLEESWKILSEIRINYFILAFSTYILSVYFFAVRWQQVLASVGYNLTAKSIFPILFGTILVNNLTPASRTGGEGLRIVWVNKQFGVNYTDAFITILFERVVEIVPIALLLTYVFYMFPSLGSKFLLRTNLLVSNSISLLLLALMVTGIAVGYFREKFAPLLKEVLQNWR